MCPPTLTIAIPTKNRPDWLQRALKSALDQHDGSTDIEILVSDNSDTSPPERYEESLRDPKVSYWRNSPPSGMVTNWNILLRKASGKYILWLHDDDYLLPGSLKHISNALSQSPHPFHVFSARVVDENERLLKRGGKHADRTLSPTDALQQLFTHSSFIRFPSAVVDVALARSSGGFIENRGDLADLCMWSRLAASCGVRCHSVETVAYTLHRQQATSRMFTETTLLTIGMISRQFEGVRMRDQSVLDDALRVFFWRFILGGSIRALRQHDFQDMSRILSLHASTAMSGKPCPLKWRPLLYLLQLAARLGITFK